MDNTRYVPEKKLKHLFYKIAARLTYSIEFLFPPEKLHYKDIPIIINNYNRVTTLKKLIAALEKRGYYNIFIIDNNSTYDPLLEYYKNECRHKVFRLDVNIGTLALWQSGIFKKFKNNFFVYTDSDIVPVEDCPDDFMLFFFNILQKYKLAQKVGFSLKIDDIPDHNLMKASILKHEGQFYQYFNDKDNIYRAPIGATFALYRPRGRYRHANFHIQIFRTGYPYMAYHLPWYQDSLSPDEEEKYYIEHSGPRTWYTSASKKYLVKPV
jgi:glycosyltransferase involved in cell wall biosynthesis